MDCIKCINYEKETTPKGGTIHKCIKYPNVKVFGKLGNENIVDNCGEMALIIDKKKKYKK